MKTKFRIPALLFMAAILCTLVVVSCKDDDSDTPSTPTVDLTALQASITAAQTKLTSTTEGKADGQYSAESRTTLQTAIAAAQAVVGNSATTQEDADNAKNSLDLAVTAYNDSVIKPIAAEDLIAYWSFDEGSGTTVADGSGNNHNGEFKKGPDYDGWPQGLPEWGADRTGADGKALHFTEGGSVEIPYATALNPTTALSVSAWIQLDENEMINRFLGLGSWLGYKFEVENHNKPFFSMGHGDAGAAYDRDTEGTVLPDDGAWYHLVMTFDSDADKMIFYINGQPVKEWSDTPDPGHVLDPPYNLVIGQDFPSDKYYLGDPGNGDNFNDPTMEDQYHVIPAAWGGYLRGSIDELRMYKVALTASQVGALYDREKPE